MNYSDLVLKDEEKIVFALRSLYRKYGYKQYKVSSFEEYDLYMRNKNFLVSENILSFTDTDGRLMALKPDITISIVKNTKDTEGMQKFCYNENVYRVTEHSYGFKEIMQTGLECIGPIDMYSMCEVIILAAKSLEIISNKYILDISHLGIISGLIDEYITDSAVKKDIYKCVGEKNTHSLKEICDKNGIDEKFFQNLSLLINIYLPLPEAVKKLETMEMNDTIRSAFEELCQISQILTLYGLDENIFVDFSMVNDMSYYNGVIFQGFIENLPASILSGGRYDNLVQKMGKKAGAIGFAVYLDLLEKLFPSKDSYDTDVLLLYKDTDDPAAVAQAAKMLMSVGNTVRVEKKNTGEIKYKQLIAIKDRGIEILESND